MDLKQQILNSINFRNFYEKHTGCEILSEKSQVNVLCCFHQDTTPSLSLNLSEGLFHCKSTGCLANKGGDCFTFYSLKHNVDYATALTNIAQELGIDTGKKIIPKNLIETWQTILKNSDAKLSFLKEKCGWTDETIEKFEIGYDGERYTIPIKDNTGEYINIRRYDPKSKGTAKMLSYKTGYGSARLFPIENLNADAILLCEGEKDCILASQIGYNIDDNSIAAITATGGAGTWKVEWNKHFKNKKVYICYDIDAAGKNGSEKIAKYLINVASEVYIIHLPIAEPADADFTDYITSLGHTKDDFDNLIKTATVYKHEKKQPKSDETISETTLYQASHSDYYEKKIHFNVMVAGKDLAPYLIPKTVLLTCEKVNMGSEKKCTKCLLMQTAGEYELELDLNHKTILQMVNCSDMELRRIIRTQAEILTDCAKWQLDVTEAMNIEEIRLIPELDFTDDDHEYVVRIAYYRGHGIRSNTSYSMVGYTLPNPKNQYATHLLTEATPAKDSMESFMMTPLIGKQLEIFQVPEDQSVSKKFDIIHADIEQNITKIFGRRDLLTAYDLAYHSVLRFKFAEDYVKRGWVDALILGDTRCGKTQSAERLIKHYQLGEMFDAEHTTLAGLIGGLQQSQNRWILTWGKWPLNDRRLLIIDEASGLNVEQIAALSGMRSEGIAELIKVQTERTYSRTRIIWQSNPRSENPLNTYSQGIYAVKELFGRPEDIARLDFAVTAASGEIPLSTINQVSESMITHIYTSELCRNLILWAWSRKANDIVITEESVNCILTVSEDLSDRYTSVIPLVEPAEQRIKVARLAVAIAARVFSTDETYEKIIVLPKHVKFVWDFLMTIYNKPSMAYDIYSEAQKKELNLSETEIEQVISGLQIPIGGASALKEVISYIADAQQLTISDLIDVTGLERPDIKKLISTLVRKRAIKKKYTFYVKTPAFIRWLRQYLEKLKGEN